MLAEFDIRAISHDLCEAVEPAVHPGRQSKAPRCQSTGWHEAAIRDF